MFEYDHNCIGVPPTGTPCGPCHPFERPSFTGLEDLEGVKRRLHEMLCRMTDFQKKLEAEYAAAVKHLTSDNVIFKDTFAEAHQNFLDQVQTEINQFETRTQAAVEMYSQGLTTNLQKLEADLKHYTDTTTQNLADTMAGHTAAIEDLKVQVQGDVAEAITQLERNYNGFAAELMDALSECREDTIEGVLINRSTLGYQRINLFNCAGELNTPTLGVRQPVCRDHTNSKGTLTFYYSSCNAEGGTNYVGSAVGQVLKNVKGIPITIRGKITGKHADTNSLMITYGGQNSTDEYMKSIRVVPELGDFSVTVTPTSDTIVLGFSATGSSPVPATAAEYFVTVQDLMVHYADITVNEFVAYRASVDDDIAYLYKHSNRAGTDLASGTDLNTLTAPGVFTSPTAAVTGTLVNSPTSAYGFRLEVKGTISNNRVIQILYPNATSGVFYTRTYTSSGWTKWFKFEGVEQA